MEPRIHKHCLLSLLKSDRQQLTVFTSAVQLENMPVAAAQLRHDTACF